MGAHGGLDGWIAGLDDGSLTLGLVVALLLGLRHATDPDHIAAVSTLVLGDRRDATRRAGVLGLSWGMGHAVTLFAFGLPVVLFGSWLPDPVVRAAELAIGGLIVALAVRLLVRWRRGYLHMHPHTHDGVRHSHPHLHEHPSSHPHPPSHAHGHTHTEGLGRSPLEAFGVGLVHGVGGSAGAGVLLVAAASDALAGTAVLAAFAAGTALSMGLLSAGIGHALVSGSLAGRLERLIPVLGVLSGLFGVWYAGTALMG